MLGSRAWSGLYAGMTHKVESYRLKEKRRAGMLSPEPPREEVKKEGGSESGGCTAIADGKKGTD